VEKNFGNGVQREDPVAWLDSVWAALANGRKVEERIYRSHRLTFTHKKQGSLGGERKKARTLGKT